MRIIILVVILIPFLLFCSCDTWQESLESVIGNPVCELIALNDLSSITKTEITHGSIGGAFAFGFGGIGGSYDSETNFNESRIVAFACKLNIDNCIHIFYVPASKIKFFPSENRTITFITKDERKWLGTLGNTINDKVNYLCIEYKFSTPIDEIENYIWEAIDYPERYYD